MSKVTEALSQIETFLCEQEQTNQPLVQAAAETYARACADLNASLSRAAALLDSGNIAGALNLDIAGKPTLCERAEMLNFSKLGEWKRICEIYSWPAPPDIDLNTPARLEKAYLENSRLEPYLEQWRLLMRDGSVSQKLALAHKIVALDTANYHKWQTIISTLEKQRLLELYDECKNAMIHEDFVGLEGFYNELSAQGWTECPEEKVMKKVKSKLDEWHKKCHNAHLAKIISEIETANAEGNIGEMRRLFSEYNSLSLKPETDLSAEQTASVNLALQWFNERSREINDAKKFNDLISDLKSKLDNDAPFNEIDNIVTEIKMKYTGVGVIPEALEERAENLRVSYMNETRRKYVRNMLVGIFIAVVLTAATVCAGSLLSYHWTFSKARTQMSEAFDKKEYKAVINIYSALEDKFQKEPVLKKICVNAEEQIKRIEECNAAFEKSYAELKKLLTLENIEIKAAEISYKLSQCKSYDDTGLLTQENHKRYSDSAQEQKNLLARLQEIRNQNFRKAASELMDETKAFGDRLAMPLPKDTEDKMAALVGKTDQLAHSEVYDLAEKSIADQTMKIITDYLKYASQRIAELRRKEDCIRKLETPKNAFEYLEALDRLPQDAPERMVIYKSAYELRTAMRSYLNTTTHPAALKSFTDILSVWKSYQAAQHPLAAVLEAMLPGKVFIGTKPSEVSKELDDMLKTLNDKWLNDKQKMYEIRLSDNSGIDYRFYCAQQPQPQFNNRSSAVHPSAFKLSVYTESDLSKSEDLYLAVKKTMKDGESIFILAPNRMLSGPPFPKMFTVLHGFDPGRPSYRIAEHYTLLKEAVNAVMLVRGNPEEIESEIRKYVMKFAAAKTMNPRMRLACAIELLNLLKATARYHHNYIDQMIKKLSDARGENSDANKFVNWVHPSLEITEDVAAMRNVLETTDFDLFFKNIERMRNARITALNQGMTAAGLYIRRAFIPFGKIPPNAVLRGIIRNGNEVGMIKAGELENGKKFIPTRNSELLPEGSLIFMTGGEDLVKAYLEQFKVEAFVKFAITPEGWQD